LVEGQFIMIFFANVKVGMKLLNPEMSVTRNAICKISLNTQDFIPAKVAYPRYAAGSCIE
jgi:hypothetical protein